MILRDRRQLGYGKFRSIVNISLIVLQISVVGHVGANVGISSNHQAPAATEQLHWACELTAEEIVTNLDVPTNDRRKTRRTTTLSNHHLRGDGQFEQDNHQQETFVDNQTDTTTSTSTNPKETTIIIEKTVIDYESSPYAFNIYQDGDGSATDPDGIPDRYLAMQKNDRAKAKKALEATIQWRKDNDIDTILVRPHPKFDICKKVFPLHFCGRDETNRVILLQRPGLIDLSVADANHLTGEDLLHHYVYEMEFLWRILENKQANSVMTSVIDLTGVNFSILRKPDLLRMVQLFVSTMDAHFPQRAHKTLLINVPRWFGAMYRIISPLLRESTKQKIQILSKGKEQDEVVSNLLSECPIDVEVEEMVPSKMESELRDFCEARLEESGTKMQLVVA